MDHLFRAAFFDSAIPQAITNVEGFFIQVNQALCNYLGREAEELIGHDIQEFTLNSDPYLDIRTELQRNNYWSAKRKYTHANGDIRNAVINISAIYDNGSISKVLLQIQDQSKSHDLLDKLYKKQEEVEQFAYVASHDLREPLTTVAGYASLLIRRCSDQVDENGKRWLSEILISMKRMEQKIDDLLTFSRAGRDTPKGEFSLGSAIDEARRSVVKALAETQATVVFSGENPLIRGDRSMVAQVFQNLFSNSLKYKGNVAPRIEIKAERQNHLWCISVEDNGLGFDMQYKDRIFGVFQRLYTVDEYPGTGIGLAIAKKIVERHGGTIWPEASPGKGATFYFTLPDAS